MKLTTILLLIILLLAGCSKSPEKMTAELVQSGYDHLEKYEFDQAREAFDKAATTSGYLPYDRLGRALILEQQRSNFEALNEYINLRDEYEVFAPAYEGIYRIYTYYGYYDKAVAAATVAHQIVKSDQDYLLNRLRALLNYGQSYQAEQILNEFSDNLDNLSKQLVISRLHSANNNYDSARLVIDEAVKRPFDSLRHYVLLADALESAGLIDSAMAASRKAIHRADAHINDLNEHFYRSLRSNYWYDAREAVRLIKNKGADSAIALNLEILIAQDRKQFPKAILLSSDLNILTTRNISSIFVDMTAGGAQFADMSVLSTFKSTIESILQNPDYNVELIDFVNTQIQLFLAKTDDRVTAWHGLSKLTGEFANSAKTVLTKAELQYKSGQFDDALVNLERLRNSYVNHSDWLTGVADIYADPDVNKNELAQDVYEQVLSKDEWNKLAFCNKVRHLLRINKNENALDQFEKYPQFEKTFADMAILKALCLCKNKKYDAAFEIIQNNCLQVKGDLVPFFEMIEVFEQNYHNNEKLRLANICADWAGENADILNFAGRFLCDLGEFQKSLELSEKSLSLEPMANEARLQKARAVYRLGNRDEAFEIFESVLKTDPTNGDANYYYSKILAEEKIDAQRTTNMARSALRSFYSDKKSHINLCRVYRSFDMEKFVLAAAKKALQEFPESPELWFMAGSAGNSLDRADAEDNLKKAIELGLQGDDLAEAKAILAKL